MHTGVQESEVEEKPHMPSWRKCYFGVALLSALFLLATFLPAAGA